MARRYVGEACSGLPRDLVEISLLLTSEVVSDALSHGPGEVRVSLDCDDRRLRIEVQDESPRAPGRSPTAPGAGRGLILLESLASDWGTMPAHHGGDNGVWFSMRTS